MYSPTLQQTLEHELESIREEGLYKEERVITTPQGAVIRTATGDEVINFCANNYLGLSSDPRVIDTAKKTVETHGYGMSSVRFICGTQDIHKELEAKLSGFLGMDDTILYAAAFDANGGLFEPLFGPEDAIISDQLNHASIIDGVRLCKADRYVYRHNDMDDLEAKLKEASDARFRLVVTDGVFSMDGTIAQLDRICDLAEKYDALVMSDESHAPVSSAVTVAACTSTKMQWAGLTSSPVLSEKRWEEHREGSPLPVVRSWTCFASALAPTSSPIRWHPRLSVHPLKC